MALARAHVVISGEVQGVGYRFWTERQAQRLVLTGWVRNRPDGAVEAVFEGEREQVEKMVERCRQGPSAASVSDVEVDWQTPTGELGEFRITF